MIYRDRRRVEARARALCAIVSVRCDLVWARSLPRAFGYALDIENGAIIILDESRFDLTGVEAEDTLRHEIAHVVVFHRHPNGVDDPHGTEYKRARRDVASAARMLDERESR